MKKMYKGKVNSPATLLVETIDSSVTSIKVADGTVFPEGPNVAVIGTDGNAETIKYESINGNILVGCVRGFQGKASVWDKDTIIARNFTEYDLNALQENILELDDNKVDKAPGQGLISDSEKNKLANIEDEANKYVHPNSHPAGMITENSSKRFVSDSEKEKWNDKVSQSQITGDVNASGSDKVYHVDFIKKQFNSLDSNKADKNKIPTKISQLNNDKNFKTESEIQSLINNSTKLKKEVVTSLPSTGKEDVIYLLKNKNDTNNYYTEYMWISGRWEIIGDTKVDLSDYAKKSEIKTKLSEMDEDLTHRTVTDAEKNKLSSLPENFKIPNPPLPIVDLKANIVNNKIHLTWINPNDDKYSGVKIIKNLNNTPTSISDGMQVYSGNGSSYYDDIVPDKLIRYRGFAFNSDSELNSDLGQAIQVLTKFDDTIGAPGNRFLLNGNMQQGWFGEVLTSDFINGEELARLIGLTAGKSQYSNEPWLKFAYMGKIEFIAKKTFRHSISWNDINNVNAVTGNKTIDIKGKKYKVRLIKGKTEGMQNDRSSYNGSINHGSEWNKLLLPIHEGAPSNWNNSQVPSNNKNVISPTQDWEVNYTDDDLLTMNNNEANGCYSWCQEYGDSTSTRLYRGQYGVAHSQRYDSARNGNLYGWRPVLELIG